ncbi:TetR/AcrR family transcriptional regulator C-terminal domain-containing protein [Nonomuraea sp. MCN248]|uniref:TetR/AcrR family transcriptional regulator C-terminal domain-containing protein n=1 Tax=Nonomuraea corallina TaxID=2989783 RepID=A0ABT4SD72_9ACTN|nr:TetR/AcrR family transcriptional regulator [Nonomuraea corallina]MDA0635154.1 TetR/AcrR family transcriptional regulator C-terminal domain-containing protein [Nonomuraea corallina]
MALPSVNVPGDRRVRRTQAALARALIQLVEERDLPRVTVADVAQLAGVSRSTFYDHYRDVHELAEAACTTMIDKLLGSLPSPCPGAADPGPEAIRSLEEFFTSLAEHAGLYRALLGPQGSARVSDHIRRRSIAAIQAHLRADDPDEHHVPAAFTAGALIGVAADWLQRGRPHTPAEMAARTWPLIAALWPPRG